MNRIPHRHLWNSQGANNECSIVHHDANSVSILHTFVILMKASEPADISARLCWVIQPKYRAKSKTRKGKFSSLSTLQMESLCGLCKVHLQIQTPRLTFLILFCLWIGKLIRYNYFLSFFIVPWLPVSVQKVLGISILFIFLKIAAAVFPLWLEFFCVSVCRCWTWQTIALIQQSLSFKFLKLSKPSYHIFQQINFNWSHRRINFLHRDQEFHSVIFLKCVVIKEQFLLIFYNVSTRDNKRSELYRKTLPRL